LKPFINKKSLKLNAEVEKQKTKRNKKRDICDIPNFENLIIMPSEAFKLSCIKMMRLPHPLILFFKNIKKYHLSKLNYSQNLKC